METLIFQCPECLGVDDYLVPKVMKDGLIVRLHYCVKCHEMMVYIGSC